MWKFREGIIFLVERREGKIIVIGNNKMWGFLSYSMVRIMGINGSK